MRYNLQRKMKFTSARYFKNTWERIDNGTNKKENKKF